MPRIVCIIPSRIGSTRLPQKPLRPILGKPMIEWVYEGASKSKVLSEVVVATDSEVILDAVRAFGGKCVMTSASCPSGTDRVAEAAASVDCDIVVNVQGDEPMVDEVIIDSLVKPFSEEGVLMTSLMTELKAEEVSDTSAVKVVCKKNNDALYFSRFPIPFDRDGLGAIRFKHLGFYAYRKDFLLHISKLEPTPLERAECLEQLRVLENGFSIRMARIGFSTKSVDTLQDLLEVERMLGEKLGQV